ncbi:MAG: Hsp20/alpha crystallin family protein [Planctomycetota bacterium]|jgi:HSP20 family protein
MTTTSMQPAAAAPTRAARAYRPNVDILERENELLVLADMPGTKADAIDIRYENGLLTIHGKVEPRTTEGRRSLLQEYGVGDFHRTFRLGEEIDAAGIHAGYVHGVLTVHLPKVEAAKPRKIEVKSV